MSNSLSRRRHRGHRAVATAAAVLVGSLALAGCSASDTDAASSDSADGLSVVASTDVYGSLAQQVGGDDVTVTSLIHSSSQDPHSYEASARDKLAVRDADLVISNGGGYDDFFSQLQESVGGDPASIVAADLDPTYQKQSAGGGEANEHVWYRFSTASAVVEKIADDLAAADAEHADSYRANAKELTGRISDLQQQTEDLAEDAQGKKFLITEPVPLALLEAAGLSDATPEGLSEAVEEGDEIAPATLNDASNLLTQKSVAVLAYNTQTADDQTQKLDDAAKAAGVPVVDFTETLPEGVTDYVTWMSQNVEALKKAMAA